MQFPASEMGNDVRGAWGTKGMHLYVAFRVKKRRGGKHFSATSPPHRRESKSQSGSQLELLNLERGVMGDGGIEEEEDGHREGEEEGTVAKSLRVNV